MVENSQDLGGQPLEVIAGEANKPLVISGIEIPCYVLEGEMRVLSLRGVTAAIGLNPDIGFRMPELLSTRAMRNFVDGDLALAVKTPIVFKNPAGGGTAYGYPADILVKICSAILSSKEAGQLPERYEHIGHRSMILVKAFATVGIISLIDEATGYQNIRARRALAEILEKFIAKELQDWTKTFPDDFYEEIYRLRGWGSPWSRGNHPQVVGKYTNDVVYSRISPVILEELRNKNPTLPSGYRENKHHQWLTPDVGHPKLKEHLAAITALMRASRNWEQFDRALVKSFPIENDQLAMDIKGNDFETNIING